MKIWDTVSDRIFLLAAVQEARKSLDSLSTPVGAVLVDGAGSIVGVSHSQASTIGGSRSSSLLHAELSLLLDNHSLFDGASSYSLYCSLEPCHMCMGAIIVSRIKRVVWAADDYWGGCTRIYEMWKDYLQERLPQMTRTPFPDLQRQSADLWLKWRDLGGSSQHIEKMLKWQLRIEV